VLHAEDIWTALEEKLDEPT
jgi:hypothetical protein